MRTTMTLCMNMLLRPFGWQTKTTPTERLFLLSSERYLMCTLLGDKHHIHMVRVSLRIFTAGLALRLAIRRQQYGQRQLQLEWSVPYLWTLLLKFNFTDTLYATDTMATKFWCLSLTARRVVFYWNCVIRPMKAAPRGFIRSFRWAVLAGRADLYTETIPYGNLSVAIPASSGFAETQHQVELRKVCHLKRWRRFWKRDKSWSYWTLRLITGTPGSGIRTRRYPGILSSNAVLRRYVEEVNASRLLIAPEATELQMNRHHAWLTGG